VQQKDGPIPSFIMTILHRNTQKDKYGYIDSAYRPDQKYMYFMGSVRPP